MCLAIKLKSYKNVKELNALKKAGNKLNPLNLTSSGSTKQWTLSTKAHASMTHHLNNLTTAKRLDWSVTQWLDAKELQQSYLTSSSLNKN